MRDTQQVDIAVVVEVAEIQVAAGEFLTVGCGIRNDVLRPGAGIRRGLIPAEPAAAATVIEHGEIEETVAVDVRQHLPPPVVCVADDGSCRLECERPRPGLAASGQAKEQTEKAHRDRGFQPIQTYRFCAKALVTWRWCAHSISSS